MNISISLIRCYKKCRRAYELRYIEGLLPKVKSNALADGISYHAGIEQYYKDGTVLFDENNPKVSAMIRAYVDYIAPNFSVKSAEEWFEYKLTPKHNLVGKIDAISTDGLLVEHKTTSSDVDDEYIYNLAWDEQIPTYLLAKNATEMYYTICKKPTIRQKQNESAEEFYERCVKWYSEETDTKIRVIKVSRNINEIKTHRKNLVSMAREIDSCKNFYRNPCSCTQYGSKCEYASVCLNYDPKFEYIEFEKKEKNQKGEKEDEQF